MKELPEIIELINNNEVSLYSYTPHDDVEHTHTPNSSRSHSKLGVIDEGEADDSIHENKDNEN